MFFDAYSIINKQQPQNNSEEMALQIAFGNRRRLRRITGTAAPVIELDRGRTSVTVLLSAFGFLGSKGPAIEASLSEVLRNEINQHNLGRMTIFFAHIGFHKRDDTPDRDKVWLTIPQFRQHELVRQGARIFRIPGLDNMLYRIEEGNYDNEDVDEIIEGDYYVTIKLRWFVRRDRGDGGGAYYGALSFKRDDVLNYIKSKKSIVEMKNTDQLCFGRSIGVCLGKMMVSGYYREEWITLLQITIDKTRGCKLSIGDVTSIYTSLKRGTGLQKQLAQEIYTLSGVIAGWVTISDIPLFEQALGCWIRVYDLENSLMVLYDGTPEETEDNYGISLLKDGMHYHPVLSERGLLEFDCKCSTCSDHFDARKGHSCDISAKCNICKSQECDSSFVFNSNESPDWRRCDDCNRVFPTKLCHDIHKSTLVCERFKKCGKSKCKVFPVSMYDNWRLEHKCGDWICTNCNLLARRNENHYCYMSVTKTKSYNDQVGYFDFECYTNEDNVHVVSHAVMVHADGTNEQVFYGSNCDDSFCSELFCYGKYNGWTMVAHNGQGYDFIFILKWALYKGACISKVIRAGMKIKFMTINGVRFIDSLNFLSMSLAKFPKTFGIKEMAKGYFPHLFNKPDNWNYTGQIPDKSYYTPDKMPTSMRDDFFKWYDEQQGTWDFHNEIIKYCKSDVALLREGCETFRSTFCEFADTDPFGSITIAGACLNLWRASFMPKLSVAILSPEVSAFIRRGFFGGRTQVFKAIAHTNEYSIHYRDITSLYPYVNYTFEYPLGHPKVEDVCTMNPDNINNIINNVFGFVEVDVRCPPDVYIPVLPEHKHHKLMFDNINKSKYVVSTLELREALKYGAVVTYIYKMVYWEETTTELFKSYVRTFLKLKQEASGWGGKIIDGKQVETEEEMYRWIQEYYQAEGIEIDISNVKKNPGLRAIAKLCLNSLWGKFAQKTDPTQSVYLKKGENDAELYNILSSKIVTEIHDIGDDYTEMVFTENGGEEVDSNTTNISIAAFTTVHARLQLYQALKKLQSKLLYCDTDSVVYLSDCHGDEIPLGGKLGEWTDESPDDPIESFVALGPKVYAYKTKSGEIHTKTKGFSMIYKNDAVLNYYNYCRGLYPMISEAVRTNNVIGLGNDVMWNLDISVLDTDLVRKAIEAGLCDNDKYHGEAAVQFMGAVIEKLKLVRKKTTYDMVTIPDEAATKILKPTAYLKGFLYIPSMRIFPYGYNGVLF